MTAADRVPVLESERLLLRGHRADDLAASFAMWSDLDVVRHVGGRPSSEEESWRRLLQFAGLWATLGYGYWLVDEKGSGRSAREVGFGDFRRVLDPPLGAVPEAGWVLSPWCHGSGYATEAVRAVLAWSDSRFSRTVCLIAPDNAPSIRVAEKSGYREFARSTYKDAPAILYERFSPSRTPG